MRRLSKAIPILIGIIALDFTIVFGLEAWRIFTSPTSGFEQGAFAKMIFGLGRFGGLGPDGHVNLAMLFGAINLTIAIMFGLYVASRIGALRGRPVAHDLLDAALILVVASTIIAATPAILQGAPEILIQQRLPLWLVGLAATLSMIERLPEIDDKRRPGFWERMLLRRFARHNRDRTAYVTPALRDGGSTMRWGHLRSEAGMKLRVETGDTATPWFALRGR
jgi:hypothetical protein